MNESRHIKSKHQAVRPDIEVSLLLERAAIELSVIANAANSVQHALGKAMDETANLSSILIVEFQALDHMQQKLEDLSKLSDLLSDTVSNTEGFVSSSQLQNTLSLRSLALRLEKYECGSSEALEGQEGGSFALF